MSIIPDARDRRMADMLALIEQEVKPIMAERNALRAALREAMEWDWLTDAELIPAEVRARLEGFANDGEVGK